jgi:alkylation response protein AidB-like acyl-CoA dehydrogenase
MPLCGCACYVASPQTSQAIFPQVVEGLHLSTLARSTQESRSHFWAPISQGEQRDSQVLLNGQKSFVTSVGHTDGYVVSTRTPGTTRATSLPHTFGVGTMPVGSAPHPSPAPAR